MKFGHAEGTPEEIKNFFQDNGLKAEDYFQIPEKPLKPIWLAIPAVFLFVSLAALGLVHESSKQAQWFVFLLGCGSTVWLAAVVQLRFKQPWASAIVGVGFVLLLLVALGLVTPLEAFDELKSLKK